MSKLCYLDCATQVESAGMLSVNGLERFNGVTVTYLADGVKKTGVVTGGTLVLDAAADIVIVGLPFTTTIDPRSLESFSEFGTSQSRRKTVTQVLVSVWQSVGGKVRDASGSDQDIRITRPTNENPTGGQTLTLQTGVVQVNLRGNSQRKKRIVITHDDPYPFTLLGLFTEMEEHPK